MKIGFYYNPIFLEHVDLHSPYHPESPERIQCILDHIKDSDIQNDLVYRIPYRDDAFFIKTSHSYEHFEDIYSRLTSEKSGQLNQDTYFSPKTLKAALISANTGCEAARDIIDGGFRRAFCCVRPPGHHANKEASMGFCLFNNVAITANYLRFKGFHRIMIIDFDVHHGNGTQDFFYDRDDILYISMHEKNLYPHSGFSHQKGVDNGIDHTINVQMLENEGIKEFKEKFDANVRERVLAFDPDVLLFSAGFDAHVNDSVSSLRFKSADYFELTRFFLDCLINKNIPIISFLEGGYHLRALAESVYYHLKALIELE